MVVADGLELGTLAGKQRHPHQAEILEVVSDHDQTLAGGLLQHGVGGVVDHGGRGEHHPVGLVGAHQPVAAHTEPQPVKQVVVDRDVVRHTEYVVGLVPDVLAPDGQRPCWASTDQNTYAQCWHIFQLVWSWASSAGLISREKSPRASSGWWGRPS